MRILTKPIEYEHRTVREWLELLLSGELALPRFQRSYVWTDSKIADLVMALLVGRPVGTMLLIDRYTAQDPKGSTPNAHTVKERFSPRPLSKTRADLTDCKTLILDGQQRLTSLWRALELSPDTQLVETERHERHAFLRVADIRTERLIPVSVEHPKQKNAARYMRQVTEAAKDNMIPLYLFDPRHADPHKDIMADPLYDWCKKVTHNNMDDGITLMSRISRQLRDELLNRQIWYASLPSSMERSEAIDVYVKVNESSAVIRKFDIAVAEYESQTTRSLRQQIWNWAAESRRSEHFFGTDEEELIPELGELVLRVACLQEGKNPTGKHFTDPSVIACIANADRLRLIFAGIKWVLDFLAEERIWRDKHLPSVVPLRVLPALFPDFEEFVDGSDGEGRLRRYLRSYLWRSFLTDRYSGSATTRLKEDFDKMRRVLRRSSAFDDCHEQMKKGIPIFSESYALPRAKVLHDLADPLARPTNKNTLSRALMVASLKAGARDFGSGQTVSENNIDSRQAHHLFPKGFLHSLEPSVTEQRKVNHCLNYALVSGSTNRKMSAKPPLVYLRDRLGKDPGLSEEELKTRIQSHLIPYGALCVKEECGVEAYEAFLKERARRMGPMIRKLADGDEL